MLPPAQNSPVAPRWPQTNASSSTWYRERLCPHLWLPLSLDPHYSPSSTRQTKLLSLCFNLVISCILFLLLKCLASFPCHYGQRKLLPILQNPSQMLHSPRHFPGHHQLSPHWSTLLIALSWQASSHSVTHQSQLPVCLVIPAGS